MIFEPMFPGTYSVSLILGFEAVDAPLLLEMPCAPLKQRVPGSISCGCLPGFEPTPADILFADPEMPVCLQCPAGHAKSMISDESCSPCLPGLYQDQLGQDSCKGCAPGTFGPSRGLKECASCEPGKHTRGLDSQPACSNCEPGSYSTGGARICPLCPAASTPLIQVRRAAPPAPRRSFRDRALLGASAVGTPMRRSAQLSLIIRIRRTVSIAHLVC